MAKKIKTKILDFKGRPNKVTLDPVGRGDYYIKPLKVLGNAPLKVGLYDSERKKINLIVLHHTATSEKATWKEMSDIGKQRLYKDYSHSYHYDPITEKETFIAYHYLIYKDGSVRECLDDDDIGWHCGNWEKNTRSIGIAFVGNYVDQDPTSKQIESAADVIKNYDHANLEVLCHNEIIPTACPGKITNYRDKMVDLVNGDARPKNDSLPPLGDTLDGFRNCFITVMQRWPDEQEEGEFKDSGEEPYTYVQKRYLHPKNDEYEKRIEGMAGEVAGLNKQIRDLRDTDSKLRDQLAKAGEKIDSLRGELSESNNELDAKKEKLKEIQKVYVDELSVVNKKLEQERSENQRQSEQIKQQVRSMRGLQVDLETRDKKIKKLENENEELKELNDIETIEIVDNIQLANPWELIVKGVKKLFTSGGERK